MCQVGAESRSAVQDPLAERRTWLSALASNLIDPPYQLPFPEPPAGTGTGRAHHIKGGTRSCGSACLEANSVSDRWPRVGQEP